MHADCPEDLQSEKNSIDNVAVKVKFINRSKKTAQLVWINHRGKREKQKAIAPGKCYTTTSYECHYWIAHDVQNPDDELYLNYAFFYSPWKTKKKKERVLITQSKCQSTGFVSFRVVSYRLRFYCFAKRCLELVVMCSRL